MHIERVQVEEGFLDGLDVEFTPGLNVIIGARGTGKTSLIELIRFCLGAHSHTTETEQRSWNHALSVLGSGQVTVILSDGGRRVNVTRTADDMSPRASAPFSVPIIFSQTEIEAVGLEAVGRLRILDSFLEDELHIDSEEAAAVSDVRSLTAEAGVLRRDIDELERQLSELPSINQQLSELTTAEQRLSKVSTEAAEKKQKLDTISASISTVSVAAAAIGRFKQLISSWYGAITNIVRTAPQVDPWPSEGGTDLLTSAYERIYQARQYLRAALNELEQAAAEVKAVDDATETQKISLEEQARQLRREIENLQSGAGSVTRQGQQLRARKAQLESLKNVRNERDRQLQKVLKQRDVALDHLDMIRANRVKSRVHVAERLNTILGPKIRISIEQAGQFAAFAAAIADILRGSGLRYNDLAKSLAEQVSPRELLEATDANDFELISDAVEISKDRALRVLTQLREADLGLLATVTVEDDVKLQLLDGQDYKDLGNLSTGQRCTVILPLVLQHTKTMLIVDQPEDHIDNAFIVDTLIQSLVSRDTNNQIIFSTHNANIPVLGNADQIIQLNSDGLRGFVEASASLEDDMVVRAITNVMEGGVEAFERRAAFYSRHKKQ